MKNLLQLAALSLFVCFAAGSSIVAAVPDKKLEILPPRNYKPLAIKNSPQLQSIIDSAVREVIGSYPSGTFRENDIAATLIDMRDPDNISSGSYRGDQKIYPASVVKLFYLAAIHRQLEDGKIKLTPELTRGIRDMIVDSSNEATQYILDVLTGTSSGAELPEKEFAKWQFKRDRVNRFFSSLGYTNINVNQKTFCEDAYGIEQQTRRYKGENRNMLTTDATARLMAEIVLGRIASPARTQEMMDLLKRDPFAKTSDEDDQAHGFTGRALIEKGLKDAKIWSKAGWTSKTRHDVAYIELADGRKFVLAVFTENHATDKRPIPAIASRVIDQLNKL